MSTIFHEGRKVLRQEIGNPNYAEIADFLYFRENVSKYTDSDNNRFFLLPNVEYISNEIGFGKTLVSTALTKLEDKEFIKKVKHKCYDGAVRIKIYITDKFKGIMRQIASLRTSNRAVNDVLRNDTNNGELDSPQNDISDSPQKPISIIKEEDNKRKNNNMLELVTFDLDFKDEDITKLAQDNNVDPTCLFMNVLALKELNLFTDTGKLLNMALQLCIVNDNPDELVSTDIHYSKLYEVVDLERGELLTPSQHLYLSSML
ncbi:hypothetical protein OAO18_08605, partial [Francisellaceae bacterium]|nr:hypothetical protein [Francisellaceae bacterium]